MKSSSKFILVLFTFSFIQLYSQIPRKRLYLPTIYEDEKLDLFADNKMLIAQRVQEQRRHLYLLARRQEFHARMDTIIARSEMIHEEKEKPARDCCGCLSRVCELALSLLDHLMENNER